MNDTNDTAPVAVTAAEADPAPWAIAAERAATEEYAMCMGDPDGNEDTHSARMAAAKAIEVHAAAALASAPAGDGGARWDALAEAEKAREDAQALGWGFTVDGERVDPSRVAIFRAKPANAPQPVDPTADGTLESLATSAGMLERFAPELFPAGADGKLNFARVCMEAAAGEIRAYLATTPAAKVDAGDSVLIELITELARRDIQRTQTDFIGRMHQAMGAFEFVCDEHGDGEWPEAARDDAGESLAALAGLALAQLAMVSNPTDPIAALALSVQQGSSIA